MPWGLLLDLQRTGSSRALQLNFPGPVSALKLHFPYLNDPLEIPSESSVARSWMSLVKRLVATLEHVGAVHEPGHLAPWECERPTFECVERASMRGVCREGEGGAEVFGEGGVQREHLVAIFAGRMVAACSSWGWRRWVRGGK